jgi:hypothetical protein
VSDPVHPADNKPAPSLHASALWYGSQGLQVFPLQPGSKVPFRGSRGCKMASSDPELINAWWTGNPHANIGIATGHLVDVIDIDGAQGHLEWSRKYGDTWAGLIILGTVSTPRPGGMHLYVPARKGMGNKAALLPAVDYRGAGGYVVAAPSRNDQGTYRWLRPLNMAHLQAVAA